MITKLLTLANNDITLYNEAMSYAKAKVDPALPASILANEILAYAYAYITNYNKLNFKRLHNSLLKLANYDSDIVWMAISKAYLTLDTSMPISNQIAYLHKSARGHILDIYTKHRNTACIPESQCQKYIDDDTTVSKLEVLTATTDTSEDQYNHRILADTPQEYKVGMSLILEAIWAGSFKKAMTPELIRQKLKTAKIKGNLRQMSIQILTIIRRAI